MATSLQSWAPQARAVLRIVAALLFIEHGTQKILSFPASDFAPSAGSLLWFAGVIEIVGGVLFLLGLFTRPVAFILCGQMAVAYWMAHAPQGVYPVVNGGEGAILYCFIFLYFVFAGPGSLSMDARRA